MARSIKINVIVLSLAMKLSLAVSPMTVWPTVNSTAKFDDPKLMVYSIKI